MVVGILHSGVGVLPPDIQNSHQDVLTQVLVYAFMVERSRVHIVLVTVIIYTVVFEEHVLGFRIILLIYYGL